MSDVTEPFEKCAACGRWKGDHVVPSGLNGMFRVLLCPERKVVDKFYQEYTAPVSEEPEEASPPSLDAVELERLRRGFKRLIRHYRGQAYRRGPGVGREALLKVCNDMEEMLRRHRGSQG